MQTEDVDACQSTVPAIIEMAKFGTCREVNSIFESSLLVDDVRRELLEKDVVDGLVRRLSRAPESVRPLFWELAISLAKYG